MKLLDVIYYVFTIIKRMYNVVYNCLSVCFICVVFVTWETSALRLFLKP